MSSRLMQIGGVVGAAALALGLALWPASGGAQSAAQAAAGPFAHLSGSWSGGGAITMATGANERIRCRVRYSVGDGGNSVHLDLRCASDSYRFDLSSEIVNRGGSLSGTWNETSRGVAGTLTGRATSTQIQALAETNAFSAQLTIVTRGDRQTVAIRSPGSELREVSMSLRKGGG